MMYIVLIQCILATVCIQKFGFNKVVMWIIIALSGFYMLYCLIEADLNPFAIPLAIVKGIFRFIKSLLPMSKAEKRAILNKRAEERRNLVLEAKKTLEQSIKDKTAELSQFKFNKKLKLG